MITETLTLHFQNEDQQRRFHERLNTPAEADDDAFAVQSARDRLADIVKRAVLAERERCAKLLESHESPYDNTAHYYARIIRENEQPA